MDDDMLRINNERLERELAEAKATLRDQFAMAALTGLCANPSFPHDNRHDVSELCYFLAGGMMLERKQPSSTNPYRLP